MKPKNIVIFSDGDPAVDCHRFFTKYGFEVSFFVLDWKETPEKLCDVAAFAFARVNDEMLVDLDCPVIIASNTPAFISAAGKKLGSLTIHKRQIFTEPLIYSAWLEKLIDKLSFNSTDSPNEFISHLLDTHPPALAESQPTAQVLAEYMSQKIQRETDPELKTLAVYYPSKAYRMNLGSEKMYDKIRKQGYNVIFLFGVLCDDEFEKRKYSYYAGHDIVNCLDFVDVFIIPTLMLGLPERAKKVLFLHDIYDSPRGKAEGSRKVSGGGFQCESPFLDELDYILTPCSSLMPENNTFAVKTKKVLCWIPGGYIKLDHNIHYFKSNRLPLDSIVYAPTVASGNFTDYVSLPECGERIIEALLESFPDYKIIFRPHPHTVETEHVASIVKRFRDDERFIFDSNASFYMDNYCRSAVMVSDMSGTAFTYAFTTLRPVVFFSHKEAEIAEAFDYAQYFQDRQRMGYIASSIEELAAKTALALKNADGFRKDILGFRDSVMFNVGKAENYFARNFHFIAEDKRNKDWEYIEPLLSGGEGPQASITARETVGQSDCLTNRTENQGHVMTKDNDLAEKACRTVEQWASTYYSNGCTEDLSSLVTVDFSSISLNNSWADDQVPLIYQHRDEIKAFLQVLVEKNLCRTILDIGLEYGGTHVLFREIFKKVISIEIDLHKILAFMSKTYIDERSRIICGNSNHRNTVKAVQDCCGEHVDVLFIDGDHSYEKVYDDYSLYRNLVRKGGIIAFHDTASRDPSHVGFHVFLTRLRNGEIDGVCHEIVDIIKSGTGISYEIKERDFKLDERDLEKMGRRIRDLEEKLEEQRASAEKHAAGTER